MKIQKQKKQELRRIFRKRLVSLSKAKRFNYDSMIFDKLLSLPALCESEMVMTYLSFSLEVDTSVFARKVLEEGKRLVVPKVSIEPRGLMACEIHSLDEGLVRNSYGILEPDDMHTVPVPPGDIGLHVIPGLAFDRGGYRLGHGGGYYDRFLKVVSKDASLVGICYNCQVTEELPRDSWDMPVECLITERGVFEV